MYIDKDDVGNIIGIYATQQYANQEFLEGAEIYTPPLTPKQELLKLDQENEITPRAFRQLVMLMTKAFEELTNGELNLKVIPGVGKVFDAEAKAEEIRKKL